MSNIPKAREVIEDLLKKMHTIDRVSIAAILEEDVLPLMQSQTRECAKCGVLENYASQIECRGCGSDLWKRN